MDNQGRVVLTVTFDFGGDQAADAAQKVKELLPDTNGVFASGMAGIVLRRLCASGMVGGWPNGWHIANANVEVQP